MGPVMLRATEDHFGGAAIGQIVHATVQGWNAS